jgi:hypothetical protein
MKLLTLIFSVAHAFMAVLFACAAIMLIVIASKEAGLALLGGLGHAAAQKVIESVGILAVAVVALQISHTIAEEEVVRDVHISGPTRVRRFLSRFMVVIVVALAMEGLVATFRAAHGEAIEVMYAASHLFATGVLLAGWGIFIRLNRYAEELEPEAMAEAKRNGPRKLDSAVSEILM